MMSNRYYRLRSNAMTRYEQANIDSWTKYGVANVNPDPWTRKRHQSGSMLQSGNGDTHRNFELLLSEPTGSGFTHVSRDSNTTTWSKVSEIEGSGLTGQPAIVGTSFNRDFHAVAVDKDQTLRQWAYSQSAKKWSSVATIEGKDINGFPGVAQSDGTQLILVVKHADGTLNEVSPTSLHCFSRMLTVKVATTPQQHDLDPLQLPHRE